MNPIQLIQTLRMSQNPQVFFLSFLEKNLPNSPIGTNLLQLAKSGDSQGIESIARNIVSQTGKDFDTEFKAFKQSLGL